MRSFCNQCERNWPTPYLWNRASKFHHTRNVLHFSRCHSNTKRIQQLFTHQTTQYAQCFSTVSKLCTSLCRFWPKDLRFITFLLQNERFVVLISNHIQTPHLFGKNASQCTRIRQCGHFETITSLFGQLLIYETVQANFITQGISYISCVAIVKASEFNSCLHIRPLSMFSAFQRCQKYVRWWVSFDSIISNS